MPRSPLAYVAPAADTPAPSLLQDPAPGIPKVVRVQLGGGGGGGGFPHPPSPGRLPCANGCGFLRHTDFSNNGGTHCCAACKGAPRAHGPACQREPAPGGGHPHPGGGHPHPGGGWHHFAITRALYGTESGSRDVTHLMQVGVGRGVAPARLCLPPRDAPLPLRPAVALPRGQPRRVDPRRQRDDGGAWGQRREAARSPGRGSKLAAAFSLPLLSCRATPSPASASSSRSVPSPLRAYPSLSGVRVTTSLLLPRGRAGLGHEGRPPRGVQGVGGGDAERLGRARTPGAVLRHVSPVGCQCTRLGLDSELRADRSDFESEPIEACVRFNCPSPPTAALTAFKLDAT